MVRRFNTYSKTTRRLPSETKGVIVAVGQLKGPDKNNFSPMITAARQWFSDRYGMAVTTMSIRQETGTHANVQSQRHYLGKRNGCVEMGRGLKVILGG